MMDGDPDVKRLRLEHEHASYPARTAQLSPQYPEPHHHHPHSGAASAPPALYPPHSLPPTAHGHQHAQPGPVYRESLPDPRNLPAYPPQPTTHPGPADARLGYGSLNRQPSRSFSVDSGTPRPPSAIPPAGTESPGGAPPPPSAQEILPPHMEHGVPPPGYPAMDPHVNGSVPNGLPYPPQSDHYPGGPVGAHHSYPPTPVGSYPQPSYSQPHPGYSVTRRKQVRAQQACNNCRTRKQKCDEARPCGYCKNEGVECEYREVPPPKTDRTMQEILRKLEKLDDMEKSLSTLTRYVYRGQPASQQPEQLSGGPPLKIESSGDMGEIVSPTSSTIVMQRAGEHVDPHYTNQSSPNHNIVSSRIEEPALQSHYTGAHHLYARWRTIAPWFKRAGITDENYVYQVEQAQGPLNLYSWSVREEDSVTSPPQGGPGEPGTAVSPPEVTWAAPRAMVGSTPKTEIGGTNPDGSLRLEPETIKRFHDSYMSNMYIIHPFMDPQALREMFDKFIATYCPGGRSPRYTVPPAANRDAYSSIPSKRKRQSGPADENPSPASPRIPYNSGTRRMEFESSIENAIVLLVLALGNILEHDEFLLEEPPAAWNRTQTSSHGFVKPSPPMAQASMPYGNMPSPGFDPSRSRGGSRGSSADRPGYADWKEPPRRKYFANVDRVPGIAYFAQATDLLGNLYAGNDVKHAQAFLLAGLYYGQLGRVFESWRWINAGCGVIDMLLKFRYNEEINEKRRKARDQGGYDDMGLESLPDPIFDNDIQLVTTLFWSAVQLDSDIRAELDNLPSNNMAGYADRIPLPQLLVNARTAHYDSADGYKNAYFIDIYNGTLDVSKVHKYYLHQLELRRLLNRAHLALYEEERKQDPTGRKPFTWADADPQMLWMMLRGLRNTIPRDISWRDEEPPSRDINAARLRGKYYGAAYVISRPFLHTALYEIEEFEYDITRFQNSPGDHDSSSLDDDYESLPKLRGAASPNQRDKILLACKKCIEAVMKSTTAFDGLSPEGGASLTRRPRVTNIAGTAAAQFSNICVLAATYNSWLYQFVPEQEFFDLLNRTIGFLHRLAPLSPTFGLHAKVLEKAAEECEATKAMRLAQNTPQSFGTPLQHSRSGQGASMPASGVGMTSAHSSFSSNR